MNNVFSTDYIKKENESQNKTLNELNKSSNYVNRESYNNMNRQMDIIKGGGSSTYIQNNLFESGPFLQNTSSNVFGGNFFATPISPEYVNIKPTISSINYYNLGYGTDQNKVSTQNYSHEESNQIMMNNIISDSRNIGSNIIESSETYTQQHLTSNINYGITGNFNVNNLPENIQPKLQNIVSTANLKCELDLREIALRAKNAEYNPKRFAAVIMRIKEPKTTALIFASGKMVCTGARSEEDSKKAARQYAKIINKLGFPVKFTEFKIQNIVGSCDVRFPIRLEGLANSHSRYCNYEPEMFPGLIYRMIKPKIVLLIFVSGKIVLTGAKERNDIFTAFQQIYPTLMSFKKKEAGSISTEMSVNLNEN